MKKIFSVLLSAALFLGLWTACGKNEKKLKLGLGVYTSASASNASEDKNGQGLASVTGAAVLIDGEGRIMKCFLDCLDGTVFFTDEGKAVANEAFATKYGQGDDYRMKAYGGAALEWYEQADAFCALIVGKKLSEVQALVSSDGKGTDEVIRAGCTIDVSDFVMAVEKAVDHAVPSDAVADNTLKLGVSVSQSMADATEDRDGHNQLEITLVAAALDAKGKIVTARADCAEVRFSFDANGVSSFDSAAKLATKGEQGDAYNMKGYGGAALEWYEQAAVFCDSCVGKTVGEIGGLLGEDGYGTAELQNAGCTVRADGFVRAVSQLIG